VIELQMIINAAKMPQCASFARYPPPEVLGDGQIDYIVYACADKFGEEGLWENRKFLLPFWRPLMALSPPAAFAGCVAVGPASKQFGPGPTGLVWAIFGCSSGIIFAALVANYQQNRQLTPAEAASCGLLFWFAPPKNPSR
jgi:hypothetical protein